MFRDSGINLSSPHPELVAAKIAAGLKFRDRVSELLKTASPADADDMALLPLIESGVNARVFELIRWNLSRVPCTSFFAAINQSAMPIHWKRRLKKERILSWLNLRRYLPKWGGPRF